jgi:predicted nucleic acid-binding protein
MRTKPNTCFIDSSAFIALNHLHDSNYHTATEIARHLDKYHFVITDAVITETYALLRYRMGFQTANRFLNTVLHNQVYEITDVTSSMRLDAHHLLSNFSDHKISYCDALSVAVMRQKKINDIFTFDHHFEVMGVSLIQHQL